jgi:hypothetical protein
MDKSCNEGNGLIAANSEIPGEWIAPRVDLLRCSALTHQVSEEAP